MALITSLNSISKSFKLRYDKPVIDNYTFQCHYKLTSNILFLFCILITSINIKGKPIECLTNYWSKKPEMEKVINTYCWMLGLYTKHGINGEIIRVHSYYKWVPFMLFFQAITFYVPHLIWKMWEGGKIQMITKDIRGFNLDTSKERQAKQKKLVQYFIESFHTHCTYACGYILCEIINIINIIFNIYITQKFFGETFLSYGIKIFNYFQNHDNNWNNSSMEIIFPRQAKCNFLKFGPSGTMESIDAVCILPQNVLNEKIYLFLWVWYFILASISVLTLIYRAAFIMQILVKKPLLLKIFSFTNNKRIASKLISQFRIGDVLLLHFIEKNVNSIQFEEIMEEICSSLNVNNRKNYAHIHKTFV